MIYRRGNYSLDRISNISPGNGDQFEMVNFAQASPHTSIFEGVTSLTFIKCNLINCDVPEDAEVIDCNTHQINRCTNKNPFLTGHIDACPENCEHVIDTDVVTIDGIVVDTIYHYGDIKVT